MEKVKVNTKKELKKLINITIKEKGNECDLNFINVYNIEDMSYLFNMNKSFNGDISEWDVSHVKNMFIMFSGSLFNGNISEWNVSNVENMDYMFIASKFTGDISRWYISNVKYHNDMFLKCSIQEKHKPNFKIETENKNAYMVYVKDKFYTYKESSFVIIAENYAKTEEICYQNNILDIDKIEKIQCNGVLL